MPVIGQAPRLLVKARGVLPNGRFTLSDPSFGFKVEPLYPSAGLGPGLAPGATSVWQIWTPTFQMDDAHPWDACHTLMNEVAGPNGAPVVEYAEPDFQQRWVFGNEAEHALAAARSCGAADGEDPRFPGDLGDPLWFHNLDHAQFDAALTYIGDPQAGSVVRVAHLDTGFDPNHATLPKHIRLDLQYNFVDDGHPNDASDDSQGLLNSLGHGTGTLSILAGQGVNGGPAIGAAPFVEVVPLRVANGVVLFMNSSIARALEHVWEQSSDPNARIDVVTMSMGGLPAQVWAEAINKLYDAGVFVVTAAGNNYGNLPTHEIVFPARFGRVVAACGGMANFAPYADLDLSDMAGNYGPPDKMQTAMAAFTPNIPWARLGCSTLVDLHGSGTSAATPQIAAAAAIWIQHNRAALDAYPEPWMRVEAVRKALFDSARESDQTHLGHGLLRARDALDRAPAPAAGLKPQPQDDASWAFLRLFTEMAEAAPDARQRMLAVEALQLSQSASVGAVLRETAPDSPERDARLRQALLAHPDASQAMRDALGATGRTVSTTPTTSTTATPPLQAPSDTSAASMRHVEQVNRAMHPAALPPPSRTLRIFAYDPSLGRDVETVGINEASVDVPWEEDLQPGPVGEYLEVVDVDPASACCYAPVDLNHLHVLAQSGLAPSEGSPQFQQQMAYAVAMTTIRYFERALGRVALWSPRYQPATTSAAAADGHREQYVQRLRIYPHALRAENAYYSPDRKALLLGYFNASTSASGSDLPGGWVFTSLSHDIVAHETTHALLDGLHRRFREPTNPDVLAFHEAFADIVALFQHFSLPESLRYQIASSRGDLGTENLLAKLAVQFGQATGRYGALRDELGKIQDQHWIPKQPSTKDYSASEEPHDHGSVLVAAIFDAFLQIYRARSAEIVRLATGGSGILPAGDLPTPLVDRLTQEASKVAGQFLGITIRALDYCPPVDITFGEYLRALITADRDLVPDDERSYRVAFVSAFRRRGIYPPGVTSLAVDSLAWEPPMTQLKKVRHILDQMVTTWDLSARREEVFRTSRENARKMHDWLLHPAEVSDIEIAALGLSRKPGPMSIGRVAGALRPIEVHSVRPAQRVGPDGRVQSDLVVEITQTFRPSDPSISLFRGGVTLLLDLKTGAIRYAIYKRVNHEQRYAKQQEFEQGMTDQLYANYFDADQAHQEPFAALHRRY